MHTVEIVRYLSRVAEARMTFRVSRSFGFSLCNRQPDVHVALILVLIYQTSHLISVRLLRSLSVQDFVFVVGVLFDSNCHVVRVCTGFVSGCVLIKFRCECTGRRVCLPLNRLGPVLIHVTRCRGFFILLAVWLYGYVCTYVGILHRTALHLCRRIFNFNDVKTHRVALCWR